MKHWQAVCVAAFISPVWACAARGAEVPEADALRAKGIQALREAQTRPDAIIAATKAFATAAALYEAEGNEDKAAEMNSYLYWCKKKMTLGQIDKFLKAEGLVAAEVVMKLNEVARRKVSAAEAQAYFARADAFARAHPEEHLMIAIRFFEVADRFKGTDVGLEAMDRSLKATQASLGGWRAAAPRATIRRPRRPATGARRPVRPGKKIALFNGRDLAGWRVQEPAWNVAGGTLVGRGDLLEAFLAYRGKLPADFELAFSARTRGRFQVGWFAEAAGEVTDYITHDAGGALRLEQVREKGDLVRIAETQSRLEGDTHSYRIVVRGGAIEVSVDGRRLLRSQKGRASQGSRGLYLFAGADGQTASFWDLWFRDLTGRFTGESLVGAVVAQAPRPQPALVRPPAAPRPAAVRRKPVIVLGKAVSLFDGRDPSPWRVRTPDWRIEEGAIVGRGSDRTAFVARDRALPGDFELAFQGSSRGAFHVAWPEASIADHYAAQQTDRLHRESGGALRLVHYYGAGKSPASFAEADESVGAGSHAYRITVRGGTIRVTVDGKPVLTSEQGTTVRGRRSLHLFVDAGSAPASFRDLQVRRLTVRAAKGPARRSP